MLDAVLERGAGVQANRLLTRLKPFFVWAVERGVLTSSPVEGLRPPSPETARDRVLSDDELRAVWRAAERIGYPFGAAVQLLILTGCRRSEVLEAEWSEFDVDGRTWTILRERSKTNAAHVVPLSDPALQLVTSLPRIAESGTGPARYLFTTTGRSPFSGVSKVLERLNERAAEEMPRPDEEALRPWRLHDLRRTFASGCARLGVPVHVVEKALNHTSGTFGGIVGVYQRHEYLDERRRALEIWAERLVDLIEAADS
jgi:integrase